MALVSNNILHNTLEHDYLSMPQLPAYGAIVHIWTAQNRVLQGHLASPIIAVFLSYLAHHLH